MAVESGDFRKTDKINAMDISLKGVEAESECELTVKEDDYGKILRLALDGAWRKMLPSIDKEFLARIEAPARSVAVSLVAVSAAFSESLKSDVAD